MSKKTKKNEEEPHDPRWTFHIGISAANRDAAISALEDALDAMKSKHALSAPTVAVPAVRHSGGWMDGYFMNIKEIKPDPREPISHSTGVCNGGMDFYEEDNFLDGSKKRRIISKDDPKRSLFVQMFQH